MAEPPEVRRVNDIARQQVHLGHDEAVDAVVAHLRTFWDPRMRATLADVVDTTDGARLLPVAAAAARRVGG